ncbi:MAG: GNAT family N-acetyltransferase [Pyrinomonadaceae bacterium]
MDKDINIRLAEQKDLSVIVEFNLAMARETEEKNLEPAVLRRGVNNLFENRQDGFYVVADDESRVVGSLMITFEWTDWRDGFFWWIQSVYVLPDFRGRGVYRKLYAFIKGLAATDSRVRGFRLYVERENLTAQQVYRRLGMKETNYKMFEELV